jgi:regulator of protease activity HflC (stomatin/prohibitin superfamily)
MLWAIISVAGLLLLFLFASLRVMREYERAVVFFLGRFQSSSSSAGSRRSRGRV